MATYLLMNLAFLAVVAVALILAKALHFSKLAIITLIILLVCTAIFDSLIIATDIVRYDTSKILGIYIGAAPIEDFFYALLAGVLVPAVWQLINRRLHENT